MGDKIPPSNHGDDREDMWGIKRHDRRWFQIMTLVGGAAGSVALTWLEVVYGSAGTAPNLLMRNIFLGIGASFIAAGFTSWALLHFKESLMAFADWIREATERRRQRFIEQGRQIGREEMKQEILEQSAHESAALVAAAAPPQPPANGSHRDAYLSGYEDAQHSRPIAGRSHAYVDGYGDAQRGRPLNPPPTEPAA